MSMLIATPNCDLTERDFSQCQISNINFQSKDLSRSKTINLLSKKKTPSSINLNQKEIFLLFIL